MFHTESPSRKRERQKNEDIQRWGKESVKALGLGVYNHHDGPKNHLYAGYITLSSIF